MQQGRTAAEQPDQPGLRPEESKETATIRLLERKVNLLKGYTLLQDVKLRKEAKARAFEAIKAASNRLDIEYVETLAEDEFAEFKSNIIIYSEFATLANMDANEHFTKNLAEKIDLEKQKQD